MTTPSFDRRAFVRAAGVVAAAPGLAVAGSHRASVSEEILSVGVVGCGGRGTGAAANALQAGKGVRIVAMGDLFQDRLDQSIDNLRQQPEGERVDVPPARRFVGFDAFQGVIGTDCDLVILATPPGFRPQHFEAAIAAGKHVFMEKPVAVDASGIRKVIAAAQVATEKKRSVVAGTQRRHETCYLDAMERIHRGDIGRLVAGRCYWNMGGLWNVEPREDRTAMENQIRNWLYYTWLSGDHIVEQHVHNLDVMNWAFESTPERVFGVGGRQARTGESYGHIFDHFGLEFAYPEDRFVLSMCRQQTGTDGRVEEIVSGAEGIATLSSGRAKLSGPNAWQFTGRQTSPYVQEHIDLQASIHGDGPYLNEGRRIAESTLTAIMGREAAYTGKTITWDEAMNSPQDLMPEVMEFSTMPRPDVPVPGKTDFERSDDGRLEGS